MSTPTRTYSKSDKITIACVILEMDNAQARHMDTVLRGMTDERVDNLFNYVKLTTLSKPSRMAVKTLLLSGQYETSILRATGGSRFDIFAMISGLKNDDQKTISFHKLISLGHTSAEQAYATQESLTEIFAAHIEASFLYHSQATNGAYCFNKMLLELVFKYRDSTEVVIDLYYRHSTETDEDWAKFEANIIEVVGQNKALREGWL